MFAFILTIENRRRWNPFRRRRFQYSLPSCWAEVPVRRRWRYWQWSLRERRLDILRSMLRLSRKMLWQIKPEDLAVLQQQLDWMRPGPNCRDFPFPSFRHQWRTYYLPAAKGQNVTCLEFALADDLYLAYSKAPTLHNLAMLTACICREASPDRKKGQRRNDRRCGLYSKGEVVARARRLEKAPIEIHLAALFYFAGLKEEISRIYKTWLFEEPDDVDEENPAPAPSGPNFGWWGVFQSVAEAGLFGTEDQVFQKSLHSVCIHLVRKRVEAEAARRQIASIQSPSTSD